MYCMQSNEMSTMSDSVIAIAGGRNLAIFYITEPPEKNTLNVEFSSQCSYRGAME